MGICSGCRSALQHLESLTYRSHYAFFGVLALACACLSSNNEVLMLRLGAQLCPGSFACN